MKNWRDLKRMIDGGRLFGRRIVVGLDFDGTLSPLVRKPSMARLPEKTRGLLDRLTDEECFRVLGPRAATVRVRRARASAARHHLKRQEYVDAPLQRLIRALE